MECMTTSATFVLVRCTRWCGTAHPAPRQHVRRACGRVSRARGSRASIWDPSASRKSRHTIIRSRHARDSAHGVPQHRDRRRGDEAGRVSPCQQALQPRRHDPARSEGTRDDAPAPRGVRTERGPSPGSGASGASSATRRRWRPSRRCCTRSRAARRPRCC
jgi:hypothetical protein